MVVTIEVNLTNKIIGVLPKLIEHYVYECWSWLEYVIFNVWFSILL